MQFFKIAVSVLSTGLLLAGCTLEKIETVESTLLKASVHTDAFTKVDANIDYASGKVNFTWTGGDAIAVQTSRQGFSSFDLIGKGGGVSGIFTGVDDPVENAFAVFPSAAADCVAGNVLSLRLPSSYEYVEGQTNVLMYANVDAGNQLVFNHLASLFCIEVEEVPAGASFVISAPGKKLHGDFQVDCSEVSPCVSLFSTSEEENCTVSVNFAQGQDLAKIYVPLPVGEYPSLNVKMLDKDGNVLKGTERATTGVRNFTRGLLMSFPKIVSRVPRLIVPAHAYNMQNVSLSCTNIPDGQTFTIDYGDGTPVQTYSGSRSLTHQFINTTGEDKIYRVELRTDGQVVYEDVIVYSLTALTEVMKQLKDPAFQDVLVMAHRANTSDKSIPENSLVALNAAISAGAHFVETDTHLTSDGVVVICHDKTIDRTTTGSGNIPAMTLAQLRGYNLLDRNGNATTEVMPTLSEFLLAARGKIYVNLDYSPRTASTTHVMNIVQELDMMEQVLFYCNSATKVAEVGAYNPNAHAYSWYTDYAALMKLPGEHMVQYGYEYNKAPNLGAALSEGLICTVNMLDGVSDTEVETEKLDQLLSYFPAVRVIQTDICDKLLVALQADKR
jgi:glycerophosphoryl diester phosphodiesterase